MNELIIILQKFNAELLPQVIYWIEFSSVLWIPIVLAPAAFWGWVEYVRRAWILKQKKVLLEIKLPQETFKSPVAMELVLTALHQTSGEGTPINRYWEGKVRSWFSLEFATFDGEIHLYIWTFESNRNFLEANIYAQFPDVAIFEAEDYVKKVKYNTDVMELWGCELEFTKPDPYPIKTYVDYGLDKDPDEEYKIDPLAPLIEFLGTVKSEHNVWIQILVRAHKKEKTIFNNDRKDHWLDQGKEEIKKIVEETTVDSDGVKVPNAVKMSEWKKDIVTALERSVSKYSFDTCIRGLYIAPKDIFNKGYQGGIPGSFKQFGSGHLNGFKPKTTGYDYKWQDWKGKKEKKWKESLYACYLKRSFFHYPYTKIMKKGTASFKTKAMILNTEELATVYHFPGSAVRTPALKRIPSKRADAPSNLPI